MMRCRVLVVLLVASAMVLEATAKRQKTSWTTAWTTAYPGSDLQGKMFTLSKWAGITLSPPFFFPSPSPSSFPSTPPPTSSSPGMETTPPSPSPPYPWMTTPLSTSPSYPWMTTTPSPSSSYPWTTQSPARGVSVCLRYVAEDFPSQSIFTLSPDSPSRLTLKGSPAGPYDLSFSDRTYYSLSFSSYRLLWPDGSGIWTSVCVTVDTARGVAQVFQGGKMSVRKTLPLKQYMWAGQPVLEVSGFEGQMTDVQVWDHPLSYSQIQYYMYTRYSRGSVLTWSQISYSLRGDALLEDNFNRQAGRLIKRLDRESGPMGETRRKKIIKDKRKERKRKLF